MQNLADVFIQNIKTFAPFTMAAKSENDDGSTLITFLVNGQTRLYAVVNHGVYKVGDRKAVESPTTPAYAVKEMTSSDAIAIASKVMLSDLDYAKKWLEAEAGHKIAAGEVRIFADYANSNNARDLKELLA